MRPALVVEERTAGDAVIRIRKEPEEHLSLHRQDDGTVLLTHRSPDKPLSVWDAMRVEAARKLGYRHSEWHGTYYQHRPLVPEGLASGDEMLVAGRIDVAAASSKPKYNRVPSLVIAAPAREFMLTILLAMDRRLSADEPHVVTAFGDLYFRLQP